ncbi:hypothetical protein BHK98_11905 [Hornefia porci]|uniref:DUF2229 domain-containing protein n=1 Tax=Hornefia porci TaxID=2652292 RepID=A0A1Q9JKM9_9FIRM|nr:acyl-CoA dehydratase activase-related protein [Hornefia porci]OLR56705.1 hypothetical protein BHK98_11905 [Hornefia porci]
MSKKISIFAREDREITVGLPRALLYHRYEILWKSFFSELGVQCVTSPRTNKAIIDRGIERSIDETCLSTKIYMGHVDALIGKCDYILIPRISNFGIRRFMCTKFEALYDMTDNVFRGSGQKLLAYDIDVIKKTGEEKAMIAMAEAMGFSRKEGKNAYKAAKRFENDDWKRKVREEERKLRTDQIKIMVAGHSYITEDEYVGKPVIRMLEEMGVTPIIADRVDRKEAIRQSTRISPTIKWEMSRELMGSIQIRRNKIDGVILLSAYPCGPDSMVNEMIIRKFRDLPIQTIVLDTQEGMAGLETRLESFTDVLKLQRGEL